MQVILKITHLKNSIEYAMNDGAVVGIGRSHSCDLQLNDDKISGRHCRFFLKKDRLEIFDLDSKNGTYLNGIRIEHSEFFLGDEVKIGDTIITLLESKMSPDAISTLTFPGPFKERINYELKADFTGARIQNQLNNKKPMFVVVDAPSHEQEIVLRKKIKSSLKLSKQEIRSQHKFLSFLSTIVDTSIIFGSFVIPFIYMGKNLPTNLEHSQKLTILAAGTLLSGLGIILVNFKILKFTFGEHILGIKDLHQKQ